MILQIEEKFPVDKWMILGMHVWPIIRIKLYRDNLFDVLDTTYVNNQAKYIILLNRIKRILRTTWSYLNAHWKNSDKKELKKEARVLFYTGGNTMTIENGVYLDRFYQPIHDELARNNCSSVCFDYGEQMFVPRKSSSFFIGLRMHYITLKNQLFPTPINKADIQLPQFDQFQTLLSDYQLSVSFSRSQLIKYISKIYILSQYISQLIESFQAKVLMIVCYYSDLGYALSYVGHQKKIPLIDVQHGVQGPYHIAYGRWTNLPSSGFNTLPTHFWLWTKNAYRNIADWASPSIAIPFVGGHPYIYYYNKNNTTEDALHWNAINPDAKPAVLVSLSNELSSISHLEPILSACQQTQHSYFWLFRLHPGMRHQQKEITKLIVNAGITIFNIEEASFLPLPLLLTKCQVHVTYSSSVVIEASLFNTASIITSDYGKKLYLAYIEDGIAQCAFTADEIGNLIYHFVHKNDNKAVPDVNHNFQSGIQHILELAS